MMRNAFFIPMLVIGVLAGFVLPAKGELVVYYSFDNITGDTVSDLSGYGNDGTMVEGPTVVAGPFEEALDFVESSRVDFEPSWSLTCDLFQKPFTVVCWVKRKYHTGDTWQTVFSSGTHGNQGDALYVTGSNVIPGIVSWRGRVSNDWLALCQTDGEDVPANQWTHVAVVGDGRNFRIYVDGVLLAESAFQITIGDNPSYNLGGYGSAAFMGAVDDFGIFSKALGEVDIQFMKEFGLNEYKRLDVIARNPSPADAAVDIPRETALEWTANKSADAHDVYFGTSWDDVTNADGTHPLGVLVSQAQTETVYTPESRLDFDRTYYWRVDEVKAAPDNTIFKGRVWNFTTELIAYPITRINATASSVNSEDMLPEKTIDGSGLNELDQHSTDATTMWLSQSGVQPVWIQYEFDKVYKLHKLWLWNSNQSLESIFGFGAKDVVIEYSADGVEWIALDEMQFDQATGTNDYAHNTTVDLSGILAKYVKINILSGFGPLSQQGLSEVRFFYIPTCAREPQPASGAVNVAPDVTLSWHSGREAATHNVFMSTDEQAVMDRTAPVVTVTEASYAPGVDLGHTYYWRVDEVNETETPTTWEGDVWSFTTVDFLTVDDFESYTDDDPNGEAIWQTWIDGFGVADNGSQVGNLLPPYCELTIIHGGAQSMPLFYANEAGVLNSEATLPLTTLRNWTTAGVTELSLWFRGDSANTAEPLYVAISNLAGAPAVIAHDDSSAATVGVWTQWRILLLAFVDQGINLTNVDNLAIGLGSKSGMVSAGGSGMIFIDDIRLYKPDLEQQP